MTVRVVHEGPSAIVGVGAVSGCGWDFASLVDGVASGVSSAREQEVDGLRTVAATIPPHPDGADRGGDVPRFEAASMAAVGGALADARSRGWEPGHTVGLIWCTGVADIRTIRDTYFREARPKPSMFPRMLHTSLGSLLSQEHGLTGPHVVVNSACSSGNVALQTAELWLATGLATDVIVAGAEMCLIAEGLTGFRRMRVLLGEDQPLTDCRPFQEGSKRFFLGEGAVGLVVTTSSERPRAAYLGGATTHDAFHLVAPEPEGRELERSYRDALESAAAKAGDIALVKAHGSGTPINDRVEEALLDRLFPASTKVCSYKPLLGHCMAAAALVELAGLLASYEAGVLPPHVTDDPADPRLPNGGPPPDGLVLAGSVGLGGANAVAILDIPRGDPS